MAISVAFRGVQHDGCYRAFYALYLQQFVLEKIPKFLYVSRRNERDNVELSGYFVDLFYVRKLVKRFDDVVQRGRLDKDVYKS